MRKHVMELHVQDGRPFKCTVPSCGVKFARLRYLRRHQNLSHRGLTGLTDDGKGVEEEESSLSGREMVETSVVTWHNGGEVRLSARYGRDERSGRTAAPGGSNSMARGVEAGSTDCSALRALSMYASTAQHA